MFFRRLYQNNLTGSIPPSLGNLTSLQELKLEKNAFSGSIPSSLGNLKALRFLYVVVPKSQTICWIVQKYTRVMLIILLGSLNFDSSLHRKLNENMLTGTVPLEVLSLAIVGNLTELWVIKQFEHIIITSAWVHCIMVLCSSFIDLHWHKNNYLHLEILQGTTWTAQWDHQN